MNEDENERRKVKWWGLRWWKQRRNVKLNSLSLSVMSNGIDGFHFFLVPLTVHSLHSYFKRTEKKYNSNNCMSTTNKNNKITICLSRLQSLSLSICLLFVTVVGLGILLFGLKGQFISNPLEYHYIIRIPHIQNSTNRNRKYNNNTLEKNSLKWLNYRRVNIRRRKKNMNWNVLRFFQFFIVFSLFRFVMD